MKLRLIARPLLSAQVRSGDSTLFWHDDWTDLGPLIDILREGGPRVTGISFMALVSELVQMGIGLYQEEDIRCCRYCGHVYPLMHRLLNLLNLIFFFGGILQGLLQEYSLLPRLGILFNQRLWTSIGSKLFGLNFAFLNMLLCFG